MLLGILFFPITLIVIGILEIEKITRRQLEEDPENVWFKQDLWMWILLIFCFPAGCYIMFKYHDKEISDQNKIAYSIVFFLIWMMIIAVFYRGFEAATTEAIKERRLQEIQQQREEMLERRPDTTEQTTTTTTEETTTTESTTSTTTTTETTTATTTTTPETTTTTTTTTTTEPIIIYTYIPQTTYTVTRREYYVNSNSGKFHSTGCRTLPEPMGSHWFLYTGTKDELKSMGYSPCGTCRPY